MKVLREGCKKLGIQITDNQEEQFRRYYELLVEWNQRMNLTSITEYVDVMNKHFLDSLCILKLSDFPGSSKSRIIDVGTGAGFPGIPIKIMFPDISLTLLDSLNKRIRFLEALKGELKLADVTAIHGRAEEIGKRNEYREQFDFCVSRAVADLSVLSEYCLPLVKIGGAFVAYKSGNCQEELQKSRRAIEILGGKIQEIIDFKIPNSDMSRTLISIRKIKKTPHKYPRKSGTPGKSPLV